MDGIGINWAISSFHGWGVFGLNLALELKRTGARAVALLQAPAALELDLPRALLLRDAITQAQTLERQLAGKKGAKVTVNATVIQPAVFDFELFGSPAITGKREVCFIFFENARFTAEGIARANAFPLVLTGSKWNRDVLAAAGVTESRLAHQGIDTALFHAAPRRGLFVDRFAIFAGGKLEYRKGQDIVLAAFKKFHARHKDAVLIANWQNMYSEIGVEITTAGLSKREPTRAQNGRGLNVGQWMTNEGLPDDSFVECGLVPNKDLPTLIRECDAAVFASRAEGGTNLAAMECLACGLPTILSANTGHLDLIESVPCWPLATQGNAKGSKRFPATDGWGESDIDELVETLETIYRDRETARARGQQAALAMERWSWEHRVTHLIDQIEN